MTRGKPPRVEKKVDHKAKLPGQGDTRGRSSKEKSEKSSKRKKSLGKGTGIAYVTRQDLQRFKKVPGDD